MTLHGDRLAAAGGVGHPVRTGEQRVAHRCVWRDAECIGEHRGWCLLGEVAPGGQPATKTPAPPNVTTTPAAAWTATRRTRWPRT